MGRQQRAQFLEFVTAARSQIVLLGGVIGQMIQPPLEAVGGSVVNLQLPVAVAHHLIVAVLPK